MIGLELIIAVSICLATLLVGFVAKLVLQSFLAEREAAIAAFSLLLGQAIVPRVLGIYDLATGAFAEALGSIAGLTVLWWFLFKRRPISA